MCSSDLLVKIPVAVKISYYNASLASFIKRLSETPVKSIVLFNRFYNLDFDIHNFNFTSSNVFSTPAELAIPLRWVAIMSGRVSCDLAASTGIHDGHSVVKVMLAGASAAQVASSLYRNGFEHIQSMIRQIEVWMDEKGYKSIAEFKGKMSQERSHNPAAFERVQFMKFFREMARPS